MVFGGENEHRVYLSDVIIFNLKTATWTQPELSGPMPRGRARHASVIYDEKLFVLGGMHDSYVLDDICYLDLKTWVWSRTWKFVPRFDHFTWVWNGRLWVFGGMGEDMERTGEIWWLDLRGNPAFEGPLPAGPNDRWSLARGHRSALGHHGQLPPNSTGYVANSGSVQTGSNQFAVRNPPVAPGSISAMRFVSSPNLPPQTSGTHFYVFSSGCLLDFATPSALSTLDSSLASLDLDSLRWQKLAEGKDLFNPNYRWHYCTLNEDGTQAWLLGCPAETAVNSDQGESLSDVLPIDLRKLGLLGNSLATESRFEHTQIPASDAHVQSHLTGIGADLVHTFDQPPEQGSGADFIITADPDDDTRFHDDEPTPSPASPSLVQPTSKPIYVHRLILCSRWPHFARMYSSQMLEYQTKKMHIPEPYAAVRAFLYYLYTDSISAAPLSRSSTPAPSLSDVAGMLVMANIYDMPRLRLLCVHRLGRELDVDHAATIWERAGTANEEWLRHRAASFAMMHWGRVVRTAAFKSLPRRSLLELCEEIDNDGRVVGGDELEAVGGLGGGRYGVGGLGAVSAKGRRQPAVGTGEDGEAEEEGEDEGMDVN